MAKKILYIEDYPVIQEIYVEALKKQGLDVDVADDGAKGLEKMSQNDYDLVLLDLLLPQVSGLEFLKKLKALTENKAVKSKIIVLTDFDKPETVEEVQKIGVDGYWIKVENIPSVVAQKVNKVLS